MALGRDHDEALEEARAALEAALARYQEEGRPFPEARAGGSLKVSTDRFGVLAAA
jgi:predicted RNase H-like HicB family nuclease